MFELLAIFDSAVNLIDDDLQGFEPLPDGWTNP
jgi:hypothetical protein